MGSTLVPEIALNQLVAHDDRLGVARLDEPSPHRELAFVVRATYPNLASVEVLRAQFKKALAIALPR
jgi:LysR family hydrogen peroxide-inducible transcriptional activator